MKRTFKSNPIHYTLFYLFLIVAYIFAENTLRNSQSQIVELSGEWHFQTDSLDKGISEKWFTKRLNDIVILPGSMAENGKGDKVSVRTKWTGQIVDKSWYTDAKYLRYRQEGNIKIPFWLQPDKHYVGVAWYQKEIEVPADWKDKYIELFLERCHWESNLWVDGQEVGMQNSLATPHVYDLSEFIVPGKHLLSIRVDNRIKDIDPGLNSHSISDHTQTNWNGIVGKISLAAQGRIIFEKVKLFPDVANKQVKVKLTLKNSSAKIEKCSLRLSVTSENQKLESLVKELETAGDKEIELDYPMGDNPLLWDEFNPNMYTMHLEIVCQNGLFSRDIDFGMRAFKTEGTNFIINGRPVFLRGTLECAIFPKTGYPSTDVAEWVRVFKVIKTHGLNHMRFHSWCPPEAAFIAADRTGIYLQVECSSWANGTTSLGDGKPIDRWLYKEAEKILDNYGNHPSFCLMAYGNEPGGNNQGKYLSAFVSYWKERDSRRVYTSGAGWPPVPEMEYYNPMDPRIQRWGEGLRSIINSKPPQTDFDYQEILAEKFSDKPSVGHEIGQWCVYPNFNEIKKYTGVLKAKNFEIFQESLKENNMGDLAQKFLLASGKLQALCYKYEIEAALRTPGFAGFQLLDLHDFPGQGTALVGVLDAFWEEKGYISPAEFSRFCNQTVPVARLKKRIFLNNETIEADIEVAHFGPQRLQNVTATWQIQDKNDIILFNGEFPPKTIPIGNGFDLGQIKVDTRQIKQPQKLILIVKLAGYSNHWDLWVYPGKPEPVNQEQIFLASALDNDALTHLDSGGKVLLSLRKGSLRPEKGGDIKVGFSSIFWNTAWTNNQAPHTLGILCDSNHPALAKFPTENHSNWQWWDAMSHTQAINLNHLNMGLQPIVRIIDDWFKNRPLAMLVEARVGKGKILISGLDLHTDLENRPEARQMLYSLTSYMVSNDFDPEIELKAAAIKSLLKEPSIMSQAKVVYSSSQFSGFEASNILDDDSNTIWHTPWEVKKPDYPHEIQIDLGNEIEIRGFMLLPRQDGITGGWIAQCEIYISEDGEEWNQPIASADFEYNKSEKEIILTEAVKTRYVRFIALKGFKGQNFASLAELKVIEK